VKILFLTHSARTPSTWWRVEQFLDFWKAAGAEGVVEPHDGADLTRAEDFDLVVLQKVLLPYFRWRTLRRHARKLIYEFDDAVMLKHRGVRPSWTRRVRFRRTVRSADAVTTSNPYLAALAAPFRAPATVRVVPNAIDLKRWKPRAPSGPPRRIGWFGSPTNLDDLRLLTGALAPLLRARPSLEFAVVSERPPDLPDLPHRHIPYEPGRDNEQIASFDVAVAPLPDTPWTRGKAPVKLLCYLASGVPVVASDVPPHRALLADGVTAFLAGSDEDWRRKLETLIDGPEVRERFAGAGLDLLRRFYDAESMARQYLAFYREVAGR
jgi:glycosyltransferase involved in cell wall biosynthesis